MMEFACFTRWDELPGNGRPLFEQGERESMFLSRPWFENLSDTHLADGQSLLLPCVVDNSTLLALLPLVKQGACGYSLSHRNTTRYGLLLAERDRAEVLACLARGLRALPVQSLLLKPVAADDEATTLFQRSLEAVGYGCTRHFRLYNWVHRLRGEDFDAYMSVRPARVRNTVARKGRKLQREHDCEIRLHTGSDVRQAIADYSALYPGSWKAQEPFDDVMSGLVDRFAALGWCRLGVLHIDGKPAAAQLWFVVHKKAYIFRLVHDARWNAYSPGTLLTHHLMRHVIEADGVEELDFLTGNEPYKQDWMSERRECVELLCMKPDEQRPERHGLMQSIRRLLSN